MAGKSRVPRPLTPLRRLSSGSSGSSSSTGGSKVVDDGGGPYGPSMPRTIGIHIDNFTPAPVSPARKSPSPKSAQGGIPRPISRQSRSPTPVSKKSDWENQPNNPYRQPVVPGGRGGIVKQAAASRSPSRGQNQSYQRRSTSPSSRSSTQSSNYSQKSALGHRSSQTLGYHNPSYTVVRNRTPSPRPATATSSSKSQASTYAATASRLLKAKSHQQIIGSTSVRQRTPPPARGTAAPISTASRKTGVQANSQSQASRSNQGHVPNPAFRNSGASSFKNHSDSSDDEINDVTITELIPIKQKPTVAEQLIQNLNQQQQQQSQSSQAPTTSYQQMQRKKARSQSQQPPRRRWAEFRFSGSSSSSSRLLHQQTPPLPPDLGLGLGQSFPTNFHTVSTGNSILLHQSLSSGSNPNPPPFAMPYFPSLSQQQFYSTSTGAAPPPLIQPQSQFSTGGFHPQQQPIERDESWDNMSTPEHVRDQLRRVRKWEFTTLGRLYQDSRHQGPRTNDGGTKFTLLSYNLLAPTLLNDHAHHLYKDIDPVCLEWKNRHSRFLAELAEFGHPEILCFQEVEAVLFKEFYEVPLARLGYKGVFKKRTGNKVDGCAIFWKQSSFTLVEKLSVEYFQPHVPLLDRDNVALLVKLQSKLGRRPKFVVGTTHLLFNPKRNDVKLAQVQVILSELDRFAFSGFNNKGETTYLPIVLTGDFNTEPRGSIVRLITDGELQYLNEDGERPRLLQKQGLADFLPHYIGISDQCQHYRIVLERQRQWQSNRRNSFELDLMDQHQLINLFSSGRFETDEGRPSNTAARSIPFPEEEVALGTELDLDTHQSIIHEIYSMGGAPCTFGAGEISHKLRLCDIHQPNLDRSVECLTDSIATTRQNGWVCVDYIFYSKLWSEEYGRRVEGNLKLLKRLGLPTRRQAEALGRIPSHAISSDHFPLLAEFVIK